MPRITITITITTTVSQTELDTIESLPPSMRSDAPPSFPLEIESHSIASRCALQAAHKLELELELDRKCKHRRRGIRNRIDSGLTRPFQQQKRGSCLSFSLSPFLARSDTAISCVYLPVYLLVRPEPPKSLAIR
jgi:hypothetical protein